MKLFDDGTFFLRSPSCKEAPRAASWGFLFSFFFLESCEKRSVPFSRRMNNSKNQRVRTSLWLPSCCVRGTFRAFFILWDERMAGGGLSVTHVTSKTPSSRTHVASLAESASPPSPCHAVVEPAGSKTLAAPLRFVEPGRRTHGELEVLFLSSRRTDAKIRVGEARAPG